MGHIGRLLVLIFAINRSQTSGHPGCKKGEFSCLGGRCVPLRLLCDGVDDCGDGSDEASCRRCAAGRFSCGPSDVCLPKRKLCDGTVDCVDRRDEAPELCGPAPPRSRFGPACRESQFRCGDGECISHVLKCDNSADCADGSDERNCDENECLVGNGGCSHVCEDLEMGFLCKCPDNMRLVGDSRCEEIDACLDSDVCDQLCVPDDGGGFACRCEEGYRMTDTVGVCRAEGEEATLVFTTSKGIQAIGGTGRRRQGATVPFRAQGPVASLGSEQTVYAARQGQGSIYKVSLKESSPGASFLLKGPGPVSGLAVDWINGLLFWTAAASGSVHVGLTDGSAQLALITGLDQPCAVAAEPLKGLLFWAECGASPRISRAGLDGRDRKALVTSLIRQPVALSLDWPRGLLYWADRGMRSISRVNLEGHQRKTVVESNGYLDGPSGLAVFESFVYWSDVVTRSVCRASKHDGGRFQVLLSNVTSAGGVALIQPALQPARQTVSGRSRTECEPDLIPGLRSAACPPPVAVTTDSPEAPANPESDLSDAAFAGFIFLLIFLSLLLGGLLLHFWRQNVRPSRNLTAWNSALVDSQNPLMQSPVTRVVKESLPKLDLDRD